MPRVLGIYLFVEMVAEAMERRHRRWTLVLVPVYVITLILGWFPRFEYVRQWPIPTSAVVLAILIVQGFLHGNRRDRLIAGAVEPPEWFARCSNYSSCTVQCPVSMQTAGLGLRKDKMN